SATIILDIENQVEAEELVRKNLSQLQDALLKAEKAEKAKNEFLALWSHEIRTPMTAILGGLELLQHTSLNTEQTESLELISASANSLMRIVNSILDWSKLEAGAVLLESIPFSLADLVTEAANLLRPHAASSGNQLNVKISDRIPPLLV